MRWINCKRKKNQKRNFSICNKGLLYNPLLIKKPLKQNHQEDEKALRDFIFIKYFLERRPAHQKQSSGRRCLHHPHNNNSLMK